MSQSNPDKIKEAYLAGWKDCVDSLKDQSFSPPTEFDKCEREIAEQCFHEGFALVGARQ